MSKNDKENQDIISKILATQDRKAIYDMILDDSLYKTYKVLRDMVQEYKYISEELLEIKMPSREFVLRQPVKEKLKEALDVNRIIPGEMLSGWIQDYESFLISKREAIYREIVSYAINKGILNAAKIIL